MAARLVYIKTVSLLPKHEEAEELKRELTGELLELSAIKYVASRLAEMNRNYQVFVRIPQPVEVDATYRRTHEPPELFTAYLAVMGGVASAGSHRPPVSLRRWSAGGLFRLPRALFISFVGFIALDMPACRIALIPWTAPNWSPPFSLCLNW